MAEEKILDKPHEKVVESESRKIQIKSWLEQTLVSESGSIGLSRTRVVYRGLSEESAYHVRGAAGRPKAKGFRGARRFLIPGHLAQEKMLDMLNVEEAVA